MLSFDISDRRINIVKGVNNGGKIVIDRSLTIEVPQDVINAGEVVKLSDLSEMILTGLKSEQMMDKDAIITFSSSGIVFKELIIPKAKGDQFLGMVQNRMNTEMGLSQSYSISYTIVGDAGAQNPGSVKVLAIACPSVIIDSYRKLFNVIGIALRSVNISCNSISRVISADKSNLEKMPLLVIQISSDMLGLVLFEEGQMAFARYEPISEDDYGTPDYINEAISENIFRMTQFNKSRGGAGIGNVIVYGEISDYIKLADLLEGMEIRASILSLPQQISGYENFEFTIFANAIGALYKRNKLTERINFLEVDISTGRTGGGMNGFMTAALLAALISLGVVAGAGFLVKYLDSNVKDDIKDTKKTIVQYQKDINDNNDLQVKLDRIDNYTKKVDQAKANIDTLPLMTNKLFDNIDKGIKALETGKLSYTSVRFDLLSGSVTVAGITCDKDSVPTEFAKALDDTGFFEKVPYNGYVISEDGVVTMNDLTMILKGEVTDEAD
ncbi:MAG: pilus assembly protein PilM [Oscillospiraceae bacterium]